MNLSNAVSQKSHIQAVLLLLTAAVLWSFGGVLIKLIVWNPLAIAGTRSAIAGILIFLFLRKPKLHFSKVQIACAVAYACTTTLFVAGNKLTAAANVILLQYTAPIYVALFGAWFLNERAHLFDWVVILICMGGMVLFFLDELTFSGLWGNVISIFSGITFAGMILLMRKQKSGSPLESVLLGNILVALVMLPFMFESMPDTRSWIGLGLLGIFQLGLSYVLYSMAIKQVTALEGVLVPVVEPVLNPLWVFLLVGERPGP
ncbi:MAG: EamA family transporter, partial [Deltaproteobacteria bacterium]|nr:EamA family transporter [Deltaproteobacteria bacterium]